MSAPPPSGRIPMPMPGQQPTEEQIAEIQRRVAEDAAKAGMTVPQFIEHIKRQAMEQQRMQMMQQQQQQQAGGHVHGEQCNHDHGHGHDHSSQAEGQAQPIVPGPPNPKALALAAFLKGQNLKTRTSILNGERKDMFRVKRALRALQSPAYEKARKRNPLLPEVTDRASLENAFKLLPLSMLALRVSKIEPELGANGKKPKRVKGQWNVHIEQQQDAEDDMYYVWLYEGSQIKRQLYAALALVIIFIIVLYPLWPMKLRQGIYHLSWAAIGVLGLFFLMAIFRVILFCVTYFAVPPGLWLYPNLWEDVSFMDSFRPVWAWHESAAEKKRKKKVKSSSAGRTVGTNSAFAAATGQVAPASATTTGTDTQVKTGQPQQRHYVAPKVEELDDVE